MNNYVYISFASVILASSSMVQAESAKQETSKIVMSTQQLMSWDGAYAGAFLGYADGDYLQGVSSLGQVGVNVPVDGAVFGLRAGYNWQNGNTVYGIEGDVSNGPDGITPQGTAGPFWVCGSGDCNVDIEYLVTVRGRLGTTTPNGWLLYGTAGIAHGEVEGGIFNSNQQGGGSATGWAAGVGAERAFGGNKSFSIEYMHVDLGEIPFGTGLAITDTFDGIGDFGVLKVGINFHF